MLVALWIVDRVSQGGVGDDDRLESFLPQLVPDRDDICHARRFALHGVRDIRSVDEHDIARLLTLRLRLHGHGTVLRCWSRAALAANLASFAAESAAAVESATANLVCNARA